MIIIIIIIVIIILPLLPPRACLPACQAWTSALTVESPTAGRQAVTSDARWLLGSLALILFFVSAGLSVSQRTVDPSRALAVHVNQ